MVKKCVMDSEELVSESFIYVVLGLHNEMSATLFNFWLMGGNYMVKLMIFDLDNTLAKLGKGIISEDLELLRKIEKQGIMIAVCSGKPVYYLCGFLRQVELNAPILIGENGAVIQFGVNLPPKKSFILPYSSKAKDVIRDLERRITEKLPDMWYQPNQVGLTPFPKTEVQFDEIESILEECKADQKDVVVYRHIDSFDITPKGIDKKAGIKYLGELLGITSDEMVAIGDGVNDYPMFEYAGLSVGINVKEKEKVNRNFNTSTQALKYLLSIVS